MIYSIFLQFLLLHFKATFVLLRRIPKYVFSLHMNSTYALWLHWQFILVFVCTSWLTPKYGFNTYIILFGYRKEMVRHSCFFSLTAFWVALVKSQDSIMHNNNKVYSFTALLCFFQGSHFYLEYWQVLMTNP